MKHRFLRTIFLFATCFVASCEHPDLTVVTPNENIRPAADFIKNNFEMTLFHAALQKTGLAAELNQEGPFTVLVPNDVAFNEIGVFRPTDFDRMNQDSLRRIIKYHVLPRRMFLADIPANGVDVRYATLEGTSLHTSLASFNPTGGSAVNDLFFDGASVLRKDVGLANGVLYVLDKVMKPQFETNIQALLTAKPEYRVFVAGLKKFGLWEQFGTAGPFTVFAPTNKALESLGITEEVLATMDVAKYNAEELFGTYIIYNKHFFISDSKVFSTINADGRYSYKLKGSPYVMTYFSNTSYPEWILGYNLELKSSDDVFAQIIARVEYRQRAKVDFLCTNGVVHNLETGLVKPGQALKK
ncbi:fasciclin domain-containing protein [Sphingobacterium psychroaquaticum]|uniref:fasciclin domain-containing protein n=1 Tax=Sphingobacterium psychroaquaticum TaxID=561061 RepID=UPI00106DC3D5|nr:fasciclin domain-containing protein [Sphingobacterium psychroaquaticum]QBQ42039.1 fasciclin domain-containing protein [Sphingobacterium psychroaquaticum]